MLEVTEHGKRGEESVAVHNSGRACQEYVRFPIILRVFFHYRSDLFNIRPEKSDEDFDFRWDSTFAICPPAAVYSIPEAHYSRPASVLEG